MRHLSKFLLILLCSLLLCSCRRQLGPEPPYPYPHIKTIAICPVLVQPDRDEHGDMVNLDSELLGRILAEEWTKFRHDNQMVIIFPRKTMSVMIDHEIIPDSPGNLRKVARLLKADAICLIQLNHYQPYTPKSSTITFNLYGATTDEYETKRIINISQAGSDKEEDQQFVDLAVIQRRWDGQDEELRERAERWSNRQKRESVAIWENVFKIEKEYFRFIFNATIRDYIEELNHQIELDEERREEEEKERKRQQKKSEIEKRKKQKSRRSPALQ